MKLVTLLSLLLAASPAVAEPPSFLRLFDFELPGDIEAWSNLELLDAKEPAARFEQSTENATMGKHSLKITFHGGTWPTLTTTRVRQAWSEWDAWNTFSADVTVSRPCLVGFSILQEKSKRGGDWDGAVSRWTKTAFLQPGKHEIKAALHPNDYSAIDRKFGKITRLEFFVYSPHDGDIVYIDNLCVSAQKEPSIAPVPGKFAVAGTSLVVSGVQELGKKREKEWKKPTPQIVEQIEQQFRGQYTELKEKHPDAVLAIFREGENDYHGWKDAYWTSHGPDGMTLERARNEGKNASHEVFMRHRSPLMRVDLSSIPKGSEILAARLVVVRASNTYDKERNPELNPNMWVVEPCNRPWDEYEVNAYQYARDKFWKAIGGMSWNGDDPDFLPIYLAHGPGGGAVSSWDFREAVKFWTSGEHANHGFMLHCDAHDWMQRAHSREAKNVKHRPAVLVVYTKKQ